MAFNIKSRGTRTVLPQVSIEPFSRETYGQRVSETLTANKGSEVRMPLDLVVPSMLFVPEATPTIMSLQDNVQDRR